MFQNIEGVVNNGQPYGKTKIKKLSIFANVFELRNIAIYVISFMVSLIGLGGELSPFSISIFAACFANSIPLLGVAIVSVIGSSIKYGVTGALSYMLTALVMIATFFIIKPKYNEEERNEKVKVSKNVFIASFLVQFAKTMMAGFTIYDLLVGITFSVVAVVFYKIFVNSLIVLQDFREKRAFSIEEVIGASLLISIAVSCFGELNIFGFGIRNILSILIVMILGWKNGILVGTTSGVTIGVTIGIIASTEPIMIAAYAISGMIAGILNRFGKIGVIVGFALGNVVLAYVSNGYTVELIHFKEILIASIGLLAIPKTVHIDIEEFIGNGEKLLPIFQNRGLNQSKETAEKLNNVSQTIQEMANTYKNQAIKEENEEIEKNDKDIFIAELLDSIEPYKDKLSFLENSYMVKSLKHDEVPAHLLMADVGFVLRANSLVNINSSPTKTSEYMAAGMMVVATQYAGDVPQLIEDSGCGYTLKAPVASPDEIESLDHKIAQFMSNRHDEFEKTRKFIFEHRVWEVNECILNQLYQDL